MPTLPALAAVIARAKALGDLTGVTGSTADLISLGFTIADQFKAQEGLKYNLHSFKIEPRQPSNGAVTKSPSSLSTPSGKKNQSSATAPRARATDVMETSRSVTLLEIESQKSNAMVRFGAGFYLTDESALIGIVSLWRADGFDSAVGDQAEVEFNGVELEGAYLLNLKGFVNEWGSGFFHFSGEIVMRHDPAELNRKQVEPLKHRTSGRGGTMSRAESGFKIEF